MLSREYYTFNNINCIKDYTKNIHLIILDDPDSEWISNNYFRNKVHKNQINLDISKDILNHLRVGTSIQNISKFVEFSTDAIRKFIKDCTSDYKHSKRDKKNKLLRCPNCNEYGPKVKIISLKTKINNLNSYRYNRNYFCSKKIREKWYPFIKKLKNFIYEFNRKKSEQRNQDEKYYCKLSIQTIIDKLNLDPNCDLDFMPSVSSVYYIIDNFLKNLDKTSFPFLSLNKINKRKKVIEPPKKKRVGKHISLRPNSLTIYDFEMDTVHGCRTDKYFFLVLINRLTREAYFKKIKKDALSTKIALLEIIEENNLKINTLTIDNGPENYRLDEIDAVGQIYHCDAFCSSQKGRIENCNKFIRKYIPKGKTLDNLSDEYVAWIQNETNSFIRHKIKEYPYAMSAKDFAIWVIMNKQYNPQWFINLYPNI